MHSCDQCDYKTKRKYGLKKHIESVHGGVWHSCEQCDYKTKWKDDLKTHTESVHGYSCDQCDYKTKSKDDLKKHLDSGLPGHWYICVQCGKSLCWHNT